jgi:hypothetical protein
VPCLNQLYSFFLSFEGGVDGHGMTMPQPVVLLEPGNDFHRLDARLQQTFLLSELFEVFGAFSCLRFDVVYIRSKGHDVLALGRRPAVNRPWNTELIYQYAEPAREKGFLYWHPYAPAF